MSASTPLLEPNGHRGFLMAAANTMDRCVAPGLQFWPSPVRFGSLVEIRPHDVHGLGTGLVAEKAAEPTAAGGGSSRASRS